MLDDDPIAGNLITSSLMLVLVWADVMGAYLFSRKLLAPRFALFVFRVTLCESYCSKFVQKNAQAS